MSLSQRVCTCCVFSERHHHNVNIREIKELGEEGKQCVSGNIRKPAGQSCVISVMIFYIYFGFPPQFLAQLPQGGS